MTVKPYNGGLWAVSMYGALAIAIMLWGFVAIRPVVAQTIETPTDSPFAPPATKLGLDPESQNKLETIADPLQEDPNLQVMLTFDLRNPTVDQIFEEMHKTTGLKFVLDSSLEKSRPILGENIRVAKAPAWKVMQQFAKSQFVEGRWEKTKTGYRLSGKPIATAENSDQSKTSWTSSTLRVCLLASSIGLLVVVLGIFVVLRYRRRGAATTTWS